MTLAPRQCGANVSLSQRSWDSRGLGHGSVEVFRSFSLALVGGLILGMMQTEAGRYVHWTGAAQSLPAIVIVVWMIIRSQALPLRDYFLQRLPAIRSGRIRPGLQILTGLAVR